MRKEKGGHVGRIHAHACTREGGSTFSAVRMCKVKDREINDRDEEDWEKKERG